MAMLNIPEGTLYFGSDTVFAYVWCDLLQLIDLIDLILYFLALTSLSTIVHQY